MSENDLRNALKSDSNYEFNHGIIELDIEDAEIPFVQIEDIKQLTLDTVNQYNERKMLGFMGPEPKNTLWILLTGKICIS